MDFPALHSALAEDFGEDSEIESPEDESDAWKTIVSAYASETHNSQRDG